MDATRRKPRGQVGTGALALTCVLGWAAPARAGGDAAAADALFTEGRAAASHGDYATACAKFEQSQKLDPGVGTLFNLADCREHTGKLASALESFRLVVKQLGPKDERLPVTKGRVAALEKRVPSLSIRVGEGAPSGTKVRRDGTDLEADGLGVPTPADAGHHVVVIKAPGRKTRTLEVDLAEGERKDMEVLPGAEGADEDAAAPADGGGGVQRPIGIAVTTVGGLSFVIGVATGIVVIGKKGTANDHCPNKMCDAVGFDAVSSGKSLSPASTATLVIGLAALGGGLALIFTSGGSAAAKPAQTALVPSVGPGGAGVLITHRW